MGARRLPRHSHAVVGYSASSQNECRRDHCSYGESDDKAPPSLQGFIVSLHRTNREIKRDMGHGRDEVRILTVHGAKGLEAPIVFLPDTCTAGTGGRPGGLLELPAEFRPAGGVKPFIWPVKGSSTLDAVKSARAAAKDRDGEERNRLLYVALTRPRDRLYVAGFEGARGREAACWYDIIVDALSPRLLPVEATGGQVRRIVQAQTGSAENPRAANVRAVDAMPLPDWAMPRASPWSPIPTPAAIHRSSPRRADRTVSAFCAVR